MNLTENQTTEFKREYIDDIKKTVIAFANTAGGRIYIGIADNGEAVGVSDADEVVLKLQTPFVILYVPMLLCLFLIRLIRLMIRMLLC